MIDGILREGYGVPDPHKCDMPGAVHKTGTIYVCDECGKQWQARLIHGFRGVKYNRWRKRFYKYPMSERAAKVRRWFWGCCIELALWNGAYVVLFH